MHVILYYYSHQLYAIITLFCGGWCGSQACEGPTSYHLHYHGGVGTWDMSLKN